MDTQRIAVDLLPNERHSDRAVCADVCLVAALTIPPVVLGSGGPGVDAGVLGATLPSIPPREPVA
jgi:hypothetical protein